MNRSFARMAMPVVTAARAALLSWCCLLSCSLSWGMTLEERAALDLSSYVVTNPSAGYFDVAARKSLLKQTRDPQLLAAIARAQFGVSCQALLARPVIYGKFVVPMFYENPEGWREISAVFLQFEDDVSALAAAQTVADDSYYGECLIKLLNHWASEQAFTSFLYHKLELQTWFQVESSLFAAALAYAVVRDQVTGFAAEKAAIERWLLTVAKLHMSYPGGAGTCCNNHFYRRAVYAAMIGVLNGDNGLFRYGISAIYSAISEANPQGALPLEMKRGQAAARYQNFATMYLVFIAQIAERQGYDLYAVTRDGKSLATVIDMTLRIIADPQSVAPYASSPIQRANFLEDSQYLSWLELVQHRYPGGIVAQYLADRRPLYNRSLGGHMTLYFAPAAEAGQGRDSAE